MKFKTLTGLQNLFKSVVRPKSSGDFSAWLGNAQGVVVADDNNGVYIMDWNGNVRVVLNNKVPPYPFRPVRVGYVSESSKVLEVKEFIDAYPTQRPPNVPKHAGNHEWGGVDTMFVRGEQILPGVAIPDDDDPLVLHVAGFVYYLNGWHIIDSFTLDVTSYIPSSGAKFLLLEADDAGAITVQSGTAVDIREELVMEDIPSPTLGTVPLVAVMVYAGQVKIWKTLSKQDVVDLRWSRYATGIDTSITAPLYAGRHVAAADPTVTDDDTAGFLLLHLWLNSTTGDRFICTDNSTGAAVWASLTGGGGGGVATVTGALVDNTDPANPVVDLIAPTTTDLGGVKRNTGTAGQFVNGISVTGELEYDTPAGGGSSDGWTSYSAVSPTRINSPLNGTFTVTIASPGVVTKTSHGFVTGQRLQLSTTGALPTGLTAGIDYYVIRINTNTFNLATSFQNAINQTKINTSGTQSGTHSLNLIEDPVYRIRFSGVDLTSTLYHRMPVKWTQNSIVRYGYISSDPVYTGSNTEMTILTRCNSTTADYDVLDTTTYPITNFYYGLPKQPGLGMPLNNEDWSLSITDTSARTKTSPTTGQWYGGSTLASGSPALLFPVAEWSIEFGGRGTAVIGSAGPVGVRATLSSTDPITNPTTESNPEFTFNMAVLNIVTLGLPFFKTGKIKVSTELVYYLQILTGSASPSSIILQGDAMASVIKITANYF
jgi:hypothetical protein